MRQNYLKNEKKSHYTLILLFIKDNYIFKIYNEKYSCK